MTELELVIENSPRLRPHTKRNYLRCVRAFLNYAGTNPSNWNGAVVEDWRTALTPGRKAQTVNGYLAALRYASRRLAQRHQNPSLDFAGYAELLPMEQRKTPRVLNADERSALLDACAGNQPIDLRDAAIVTLGLRTGLRRAGMCGIAFNHFNGSLVRVQLKGGKKHWIRLDQEVLDALGTWAKWLYEQNIRGGFVLRSLSKPHIDGSVTIGKMFTPEGLYHAMKKRARKAGIKGFHPHVFRHTFVSWCQEMGVPAYRIAAMTGHKNLGMIDTYTTDLNDDPVGGLLPPLKK